MKTKKTTEFAARVVRVGAITICTLLAAVLTLSAGTASGQAAETDVRPIEVLFLGHASRHHNSAAYAPILGAALARNGIQITYMDDPAAALVPKTLSYYDALILYANHDTISPEQEQALLDFVASGKGFIPIHSASYCFRNSDAFVELVGGQFARHGAGTFTAEVIRPDHPAMQGVEPFETWDETYVHAHHNLDRTVLMERVDEEGREPYTWVRTHGVGRVFYTALGHDERTWGQPEFQRLIEQGILWSVGDEVRAAWQGFDAPQLNYHDAKLPNYERRDPPPKMQEPLSAAESQKLIQVPPEFRLELFASEPDIVNPVTMSFDERGRLWVVETVDYPNEVAGAEAGDDRIKILEDTDGDGRADKVTVFADSLNIPTSLVFANDGVIVAQAPHFLFLKDTDGDDRADVRDILMTGWGTFDTHAGPSNLQYGPDNYIWGTVGYSGFEGVIDGEPFEFRQAAFRFKPDGSDFEVLTNTTNNTWGLGFSETFDVFGSTANNDPSWYMAGPKRYFENVEGLTARSGYQSLAAFYNMHPLTPNVRQVDVHGGYTSAAGHYLYTARAFPKEYWNRVALINEPTGHLLGRGILEKEGAGFVTKDGWSLLASADEWVSPVHAQVGPDGAVWVADWYNFIVQHNPTPEDFGTGEGNAYETDLRDRSHGRIYRIVYKESPANQSRTLSKDDPRGLLDALASDNLFWRLTAQRLLVERGENDVVPQLFDLVRDTSVDEVGINGGAFHALWTLRGLGVLDTHPEAREIALQALKHPAPGVRKAAAQVLPPTAAVGDALLDAGLHTDPDMHTRLATLFILADVPASERVGRALYAESRNAENYRDIWLSRVLYIAAARHGSGFLAAYEADPKALPTDALPIWFRLGDTEPDWRLPDDVELWQTMEVPGNWERRGLEDFDGIVWFTRTFDWDGGDADSLHFGRIGHREKVWINGILLETDVSPWGPRSYPVTEDVLRPGENTITVRIRNYRREGGFLGAPEDLYVAGTDRRLSLAGDWNYRIERQTNAAALYREAGELAAHVVHYFGGDNRDSGQASGRAEAEPDVSLTLGVVEHQMKFDQETLTVTAGEIVEIVFNNTDLMQHNVVIGSQGSLEEIGAAADELAMSPEGPAQQYVPDIPAVIAASQLADPGQEVRLRFRAPEEPGSYPFVCTFPGHWRLMNGILQVTPAASDL